MSIFCSCGSFSLASSSAFLEPTTAVVARCFVYVGENMGMSDGTDKREETYTHPAPE